HPKVREHLKRAVQSDSPCIKYTVHQVRGRKPRVDLNIRTLYDRAVLHRRRLSAASNASSTAQSEGKGNMKKHIRSRLALGVLGLALVAGVVAVAVSSSGSSNAKSAYAYTENGKVGAAFARHLDEAVLGEDGGKARSAKVGDSGENPTSYAEDLYQLN